MICLLPQLFKTNLLLCLIFTMGAVTTVNGQRRIHVDPTAVGTASGDTWVDAYTDLRLAFNDAVAGDSVFVKDGTYQPTSGSDRTLSFALKTGVRYYGGFTGNEAPNVVNQPTPSLRGGLVKGGVPALPTFGISVLSGDIGTIGSNTDNSYHVVVANGVDNARKSLDRNVLSPDISADITYLDGFLIRDGNANGAGPDQNNGGGLWAKDSRIFISDVFFINNRAVNNGGGLYSEDSRVTIWLNIRNGNKQEFHSNLAGRDGGGYYLNHDSFSDFNSDHLSFKNRAGRHGGALYVGAKIIMFGLVRDRISQTVQKGSSAAYIEECEAENGGAIYVEGPRESSQYWFMRDHWFVRCQALRRPGAAADEVSGYGGGLFVNYPRLVVTNSIFSNSQVLLGNAAYRGGGLAVVNRQIDDPNVRTSDGDEAVAKLRHLTVINNTAAALGGTGGEGAGLYSEGGFTTDNLRIVNSLFWANRDDFGAGNVDRSFFLRNSPTPNTRASFLYCLFQESNLAAMAGPGPGSTFDNQCIYGKNPQLYKVVYPVPMSPATDAARNIYSPFEPYRAGVINDEVNEDYFGFLRSCVADIGAVECMRFAEQDGVWTDPAIWSPWQTHDLITNALLPAPIQQVPVNDHSVTIENSTIPPGVRTVTITTGTAAFAHNLYFNSGSFIMETGSTFTVRRTFFKFPTSATAFDPGGESNVATAGGTVIFENECQNYKVKVNDVGGSPLPGLDVRNFANQLFHNNTITFNNVILRNPGSLLGSPRFGIADYSVSPVLITPITPGLRSDQGGIIYLKRVLDLEIGDFGTANNLYLLSNPNYTAMVINRNNGDNEILNQPGSGPAAVWAERYVDAYQPSRTSGPGGLGYNYFSSPLTEISNLSVGVSINQYADNPGSEVPGIRLDNPADPYYWQNPIYVLGNFPNFYKYLEGNNNNFEGGAAPQAGWRCAAPGENMQFGRGYCVNLPSGRTIQLRGIPNNKNYAINVSRGSAAQSGWNLIGNPYPSLLDLDDLIATNSGLLAENTVWRRTATARFAGLWGTYNPGTGGLGTNTGPEADKVQSGQGFFVRASTNGSFVFNNSMRPLTYSQPRFFRGEESEKLNDFTGLVRLDLTNQRTSFTDQTIVYFRNGATEAKDRLFDSQKTFFNSSPYPNLFTKIGDEAIAINGFPLAYEERQIPLYIRVAEQGRHVLRIDTALYLKSGVNVWLDDKETNTSHNLLEGAYAFTVNSGRQDRFVLRFAQGQLAGPLAPELLLYPNPATTGLTLRYQSETVNGQAYITITDPFGKIYQSFSIEKNAKVFQVAANIEALPKGIYLVNVRDGASSQTQKFIKQ